MEFSIDVPSFVFKHQNGMMKPPLISPYIFMPGRIPEKGVSISAMKENYMQIIENDKFMI